MKNFTIFIAALIAILIRALVFTLKIGLIVGAGLLVISLCSCSASRATSADTLATESLTVGEGRADSVAHKTFASIFADKTIELTDLSIIFQHTDTTQLPDPGSKPVLSAPSSSQSGATKNNGVAHPHIRAQPLQVTVGKLTVSERSGATVVESTDSVASESTDLQADRSNHGITGDRRSTSSIATACRLILIALILSGLVTGYIIYRRRKSCQST